MLKLNAGLEIFNDRGDKEIKLLSTTPGRVLISEILPKK